MTDKDAIIKELNERVEKLEKESVSFIGINQAPRVNTILCYNKEGEIISQVAIPIK